MYKTTDRDKFIEADPVVLVFVPLHHELLDDLSNLVPREWQVRLFKQVVELIVVNVAIVVQIYKYKCFIKLNVRVFTTSLYTVIIFIMI